MEKFHPNVEKQQFLWRGKFKSKQEIDNYFSGDTDTDISGGAAKKIFMTNSSRVIMLPVWAGS